MSTDNPQRGQPRHRSSEEHRPRSSPEPNDERQPLDEASEQDPRRESGMEKATADQTAGSGFDASEPETGLDPESAAAESRSETTDDSTVLRPSHSADGRPGEGEDPPSENTAAEETLLMPPPAPEPPKSKQAAPSADDGTVPEKPSGEADGRQAIGEEDVILDTLPLTQHGQIEKSGSAGDEGEQGRQPAGGTEPETVRTEAESADRQKEHTPAADPSAETGKTLPLDERPPASHQPTATDTLPLDAPWVEQDAEASRTRQLPGAQRPHDQGSQAAVGDASSPELEQTVSLDTPAPTTDEKQDSPTAVEEAATVLMEGSQVPGDATVSTQSGDRKSGSSVFDKAGLSGSPAPDYYQLVENFAKGGMGLIWRAEDTRLHREVAYKELRTSSLRDEGTIERFVEEAQITGQLEHPNIVPVYELGKTTRGTPYYSMKLVRGVTLSEAIKSFRDLPRDQGAWKLSFAKLLRRFVDVCNAVGFAHQRGVLHRDLKPANIMLGDFGETIVLDWGLAKVVEPPSEETDAASQADSSLSYRDGDVRQGVVGLGSQGPTESDTPTSVPDASSVRGTSGETGGESAPRPLRSSRGARPMSSDSAAPAILSGSQHTSRRSVKTDARSRHSETMAGSVIGTPYYMPPEQAEARHDDVDERSDIYSLGAILYEILTGERPIEKAGLQKMLRHAARGEIKPPRQRDPGVPKPLQAVCLKAMARRKEDRYRSALQLAADVEAYLADEPVSVHRDPVVVRARRWAQKHRTLVSSAAAAATVLVLAGVVAWGAERNRVSGLRSRVEQRLTEATDAHRKGQYLDALRPLDEASSMVRHESALAPVRLTVQTELRHVAERLLEEAAAMRARLAFDGAEVRVDYLLDSLRDEPGLEELYQSAQHEQRTIEAALAQQQQLQRFREEAKAARFHGMRLVVDDFSLETIDESSQKFDAAYRALQRHAKRALDRFPALRLKERDAELKHLSTAQIQELRRTADEILLILANVEIANAQRGSAEEQHEAAQRALDHLKRAESLGIRTKAALRLKAACFAALGRLEDRNAALAEADTVAPSTGLDFFLLAESARQAGRLNEAISRFRDALRHDPEHFWAKNLLGRCYLQLGNMEAAVSQYTSCIAQRPDFVWPYITRAVALAELERFEEAEADLDRALELEPYATYVNRGAIYVVRERYEEAIADFQRATQLDPENARAYINMGEAYRLKGMAAQRKDDQSSAETLYHKALEALQQAERRAPSNPKVYRIRGEVLRRMGQVDAARTAFQKAIDSETVLKRAAQDHKAIGNTYFLEEKYTEAAKQYSAAADLDPSDSTSHKLLAEALQRLRRFEESIAAFTRFLELFEPVALSDNDPQNRTALADAYRARGIAHAKLAQQRGRDGDKEGLRKHYRQSINDYTRALELEPSTNMLARRGWAYLTQAEMLAFQDFDDAIQADPEEADSELFAGRAYALVKLATKPVDIERALEDAEEAVRRARRQIEVQGPLVWPLLFNPATVYAQAAGQLKGDSPIGKSIADEEREARIGEYTQRAVALLRQTLEAATPNAAHKAQALAQIRDDAALDPIRDRPEFQKFWQEVEPR